MKLVYWICPNLNDSSAYNIRTKTKKEALARAVEWGQDRDARPGMWRLTYGDPVKVEIEYRDAFDLMEQCLGEDRGGEPGAYRSPTEFDLIMAGKPIPGGAK